jgi:hypothetical protein
VARTASRPALLLIAAAAAAPGHGANGDTVPEAAAVLEKTARAMGGGWGTHLRRLTVQAVVTGPDGASRVTVDSAYPDRLHFQQRFFDGRHFSGWANGDAAWYLEGNDPRPRPLTATARALLRANEWHVICLGLADRFSDITAAAYETVAGQEALRLDMSDELGRPAAVFIDVQSFLPVALELAGEEDGGEVSIRFANWRELDGLQLFRKATVVDGPRVSHYLYTDIGVDRPEGGEFDVPAALERADPDR